MNGQALYRKWRSQTFDEIIAQDHVTRTLQNALRAGRIAHAYLLCGPRGTGKTSTARVLAKAANCLAEPAERPCNQCARCRAIAAGRDLDLIEIDAASNRGIDEIRELRDKIAFAPNEGRYKVYVIDEVHMLTTEAFNALLKTLEEPPAHVIFVLATTEPQRIPATILSRCQRFDFRRIPLASIMEKVNHICEAEGIRIQPAAVEAIARRAGGSFRDAESLLDQLAAYGDAEITLERVQDLLGTVATSNVADLVQAWIDKDLAAGLRLINRLVDDGADARQLHLEVVEYLRGLLLLRAGGDENLTNASPEVLSRMRGQAAGLDLARLVDGLRLFGQSDTYARGQVRPQLPLELAFAQAVLAGSAPGVEFAAPTPATSVRREAGPAVAPKPAAAASGRARKKAAGAEPRPPETRPAASTPDAAAPKPQPEAVSPDATPAPAAGELSLAALTQKWPIVLKAARARDRKLQALLNSARPLDLRAGCALLEVEGEFHQTQIMKEQNRRLLEDTLQEVLGAPCRVECTLPGQHPTPSVDDSLDATVREDRVLRYAVRDLGAQVSGIQEVDPK